jgi:hypothetical protein
MKKLVLLASLVCSSSVFAYANVITTVGSFTAQANTVYTYPANYEYGIQNNTYDTQDYTIVWSLCPQYRECLHNQFIIRLASTERIQKKFDVSMSVLYPRGQFTVTSDITVIGESQAHDRKIGYLNMWY